MAAADIPVVAELYVAMVQRHFKDTLPDCELAMWNSSCEANLLASQLAGGSLQVRLARGPGGDLLGFSRFGPDEEQPGLGWIDLLFVRDDWQGRGLGRRLFDDALAGLKARGFAAVHLWSPTLGRAHGFYRQLGGRPGTRKINDIQFDLTEYCWAL